MTNSPESDILRSWQSNASPWTTAIRENQIESRRLVTNQAIVDAVMSRAPVTALDIGCGEGWLARALEQRGVRVTGVDAIPELVDRARAAASAGSTPDFRVMTYEQIADGQLDLTVDVAIANFALLGAESVDRLIASVPRLLAPKGSLVVQTVHPVVAGGDLPYKEGWREGFWPPSNAGFTDPAPWYFRPLESWIALLTRSGFRLDEMREPLHPDTGKPASVIFIATL